jgi:asparagine synthase (glutamine-hydrolysing)
VTTFAAIFSRDQGPIGPVESDRIAMALTAVTGLPSRIRDAGPCRLFLAPLHDWSPRAPVVPRGGDVTAAGQVTLEAGADLRREMGLDAEAGDLDIAAAALERWGADGVRRLRGEYAFAAWHGRERRFICARDGIGIRVLYVGESARVLIVSNTIDAVLAHPSISRTFDEAALARFLADGAVTRGTATPYSAVKLLPEGHTLTIRPGTGAILQRHWSPPPMHRTVRDDRSVPEGYREVLHRAVADRVSGRRVTIFLSGGLDSTTIAATAIECAAQLQAITFRYRGIDLGEEVTRATGVARDLGIDSDIVDADTHAALEAERSGDVSSVLADEPGLANWREGLSRAARFSTLAVYGEDGDALLAAPGGAALLASQSFPAVAVSALKYFASTGELPYLGIRLRERLGSSPSPGPEPTPWLTAAARRLIDRKEDPSVLGARAHALEFGPGDGRTWGRLLKNVPRDFAVSLSPDVTRQRLELTLPLMDTRVISYVLSIPPIPWCQRKHLVREAFAGRLPAPVLARPKTPVPGGHEALVGAWRQHCQRVACDPQTAPNVVQRGWIDVAAWRDAVTHGSPHAAMAAWRVLILDGWLARAAETGASCTR